MFIFHNFHLFFFKKKVLISSTSFFIYLWIRCHCFCWWIPRFRPVLGCLEPVEAHLIIFLRLNCFLISPFSPFFHPLSILNILTFVIYVVRLIYREIIFINSKVHYQILEINFTTSFWTFMQDFSSPACFYYIVVHFILPPKIF